MSERGAVNVTIGPGGSYTIPEGHHNGKGKVTASSTRVTKYQGISQKSTDQMTNTVTGCQVGDLILVGGGNEGQKPAVSGGVIDYDWRGAYFPNICVIRATSSTVTITATGASGTSLWQNIMHVRPILG